MYRMGRIERSVSGFRNEGYTVVKVRPSVCMYVQGRREEVTTGDGGRQTYQERTVEER